jgi:hypothetical protein
MKKNTVSLYRNSYEIKSKTWNIYVIKFVGDLWQVGGFLRVLRFPPTIKLTTSIKQSPVLKCHIFVV